MMMAISADYISPNEKVHFEIKVDSGNALVESLRGESAVKELTGRYPVDFNKGSLNLYKGIGGFSLVFPIPFQNKFLVAYYDETSHLANLKLMAIETKDNKFELSFSTVDETQTVKGIYEDGEYIRTEILNDSDKITVQAAWVDCLQEGFESLPWALKALCSAACAAVWTGVGLAACAGCLTGVGITCPK
ncbi:hypothetical protein B9K06_22780 [Bacillus sp. OG2]|nr:hypothetical protein B9K06_22780 [Bacillus sp. OG2]